MSDRLSTACSPMVTAMLAQPLGTPFAVVVGAVRSILMPSTVAVATFPALSLTEADAERFEPSPLTTVSAGQATTPDRVSAQVQWTVTSFENQPFAFGVLTTAPMIVGVVSSTLTTGVVTDA